MKPDSGRCRSRRVILTFTLAAGALLSASCSEDPPAGEPEPPAVAQTAADPTQAPDSAQKDGSPSGDRDTESDAATESAGPEPRSVQIAGDGTVLIGGDQASFVMPSGNIQCVLRDGSAVCQIASKDFTPSTDDMSAQVLGDCTADSADAITVLEGEGAAWTCTSETIRGQAALDLGGWWAADNVGSTESVDGTDLAVLDYGQTMQLGAILCSSESTGISCRDTAGTAGFTLARESYRVD
ncbi:MAG: hypothetical protein WA966_10410 [Ornithinimicrobium sp.]